MNESGLKEQIVQRLTERITQMPEAKLLDLRRDTNVAGYEIDIDALVEIADRQYTVLVDVKQDGSPGTLRQAAFQAKSYRSAFPKDSNLYLILAAPYISEKGIQVCREEQVGCIDAAGNCYLSFGGIHVEIGGKKNPQPLKRSSKSIFSPKSSRVVRVLLSDPERLWQVQELAAETRISIGLVSRLKAKLLEEELVVEQGRRIRPKSPKQLIDTWVANYRFKRNSFREYYSLNDQSTVERRVAEYCKQQAAPYALALFSAASRVAPHVRMNKAFMFVDTDLDKVAFDLTFKPVSSGANLMLLNPYDSSVFYRSREIDGLLVVSDVQIYLDLKTYKGRGEEAADFLMQHSLGPSWEQNQTTANAR